MTGKQTVMFSMAPFSWRTARYAALCKAAAGTGIAAIAVFSLVTMQANAQALPPIDGIVIQKTTTGLPLPRAKPSAGEPEKLTDVMKTETSETGAATSYAPAVLPDTGTPTDENEGTIYLISQLTHDGEKLSRGMVWRVYQDKANNDGKLTLVANAAGGDAEFRLEPGAYLVHAGFGYAGSTARIKVAAGRTRSETIVLNAGGLKLGAELADNNPLDKEQVTFDVYANDPEAPNNRRMIVSKAKADTMLRLNADSYYVVSYYGGINAIVRADIRVQPGKLTEATVYHKAAQVTLKLVNEPGGEALANTSWTVLTPGGDQLVESVGAFPSFILAEGDYAVIASYNDQVYNREFSVESGIDRDVEVVTKSN